MDRKPTAILPALGFRLLATLAFPCQVSLSRTSGYQAAFDACLPVERVRNASPDVLEPSSCLLKMLLALGRPTRVPVSWAYQNVLSLVGPTLKIAEL